MSIRLENDRIFKNGSFPEMVSETVSELPEPAEVHRSKPYRIEENTVRETTIQSILRNAGDKRVIALNFANAMYAGGGYVLGGNAQEESLCRASLLYYTIKTQKKYYLSNRLHVLPDYTDVMIYSENVPVIRNDRGELLEKQVYSQYQHTAGLDMESYAVVYAANHSNDPKPIPIIVKSVCDFADSQKSDDYQRFAAYTSCGFVKDLLEKVLDYRSFGQMPGQSVDCIGFLGVLLKRKDDFTQQAASRSKHPIHHIGEELAFCGNSRCLQDWHPQRHMLG